MSKSKEWVVLVPPPFQGHFTPMLQLGSLLHSKGFSILVAHPEFESYKPHNHHPDFVFLSLPYDLSRSGTLSTFSFDMLSTIGSMNRDCRAGLVSFLKDEDFDGRMRCIVYDWIMSFGESVASELNLPSIVLRTSSAAHTHSYQVIFDLHAQNRLPLSECQKQDIVPGHHPLTFQDLPAQVFSEIPDVVLQFLESITNIGSSVGIIWNTTEDLEHKQLKQYQQNCKVPFFNLGPLYKMVASSSSFLPTTSFIEEDAHCIEWLDTQEPESVIYISLGSLTTIDKEELEETANALANSGQPFLWVIRPSSIEGSNWIEGLPDNFRDLIGERGQIVKWAPQKKVLAHPAVGGFLSHCGWNSTLESICEAVPMICRPCFGDQLANARYITQVWEVGLEMEYVKDRKAIESTIRKIMVENVGKEIRRNVLELKLKLDASVQKDGSSYKSLNELTDFILSR